MKVHQDREMDAGGLETGPGGHVAVLRDRHQPHDGVGLAVMMPRRRRRASPEKAISPS